MATINLQFILNAIKNILLSALKESSDEAKLAVSGYISDATERLNNLAQGAISGELSYKFVQERLKEEVVTLKNQLLSLSQILGANVNVLDLASLAMVLFETYIRDAINNSE